MDDLDIEVKAHDEIASMCFAAGIETPDGTSIGAVKNALAELACLRAERDELRAALENLVFTASKLWDDAKPIKDSVAVRVTHPIIEQARAILSRTEGGEVGEI